MLNKYYEYIATKINEKFKEIDKDEIYNLLEEPADKKMGDIALPCFKFAKTLRKNPKLIADDFITIFSNDSLFDNINSINGFLNFKISNIKLIDDFITIYNNKINNIGKSNEGNGKTICIEFSSPNIAKPFGIGHLRSTVIGNAISNLFEVAGYNVIRLNHLGDWGTQFGKLIYAYKTWGDENKLKQEPIKHLYELYVKFHKEAENNPQLDDQGRLWFNKLENGNEQAKTLWEKFRELSLKEFQKIYKRLGIKFDSFDGEAFYSKFIDECTNKIISKNITKVSEGALIVDLSQYNMPPCLIRKKDGTTLYATRDICAAIYRKEKYNFDKNIYVVGASQSLHFQQFFKVLELMGYEWAKDCIHIPFGMILGISTRKGTLVFLEDILNEAYIRAKKIIEDKKDELENSDEIADKIAISAIIFQDLANKRIKDYEYNLERIISFDGDTGPYLLYSLVRINSIIQKINQQFNHNINLTTINKFDNINDKNDINNPDALELIKYIIKFDFILKKAREQYEPSILANFLIDLAHNFNKFYHSNKVIVNKEYFSHARLFLTIITYKTLLTGIKILGLHPIKKM